MKNKKGFTLIELLAVIVILAIIALIAIPIILNMIQSARKSAAIDTAYGYVESVESGWGRNITDLSGNKLQDYYFENGIAIKGWKQIDNDWYYFSEKDADNNGYIDYNKVYGGNVEVNGTTYTFDNDGKCTSNNCGI